LDADRDFLSFSGGSRCKATSSTSSWELSSELKPLIRPE